MRDHILILGGSGNFGKRIARALAHAGIPITIAGRDRNKAEALAARLTSELARDLASEFANKFDGDIETASFDVNAGLEQHLEMHRPRIIINTCGPFQTSDYRVAETCIDHSIHYIDLADGREFVANIGSLNGRARQNGATVIGGASTVPGLSSAVLEHIKPEFSEMTSLKYGISPGQKAERGLATTKGIMTYVGKPLAALAHYAGEQGTNYGWQDIYRQDYPGLGRRWMANCDIPDLDLLPETYGLRHIRFSAGMELGVLHLGLWGLSWLIRAGVPLDLARHAGLLLKLSNIFDRFGSADGGMHMVIEGLDHDGRALRRNWFIIARNGDGPQIPTMPAIILAKKLWAGEDMTRGAYPCVGLVSLDEYLEELRDYDVETVWEVH